MKKILFLVMISLNTYAMDKVVPMDDDTRAAELVYSSFFRRDESEHTKEIKPFIRDVIKKAREDSPPHQDETIIDKLEKGHINLREERDAEQLVNIIIKAIDKSFEHQKAENDKKISKKMSACIATTATLVSGCITLTAFLLNHK